MQCSGSTPSPAGSAPVRILLWVVGEDHPKACTGRRLVRRGLVEPMAPLGPTVRALLLDPHSEVPLSPADAPEVARSALAAVDCSWRKIGVRGRYPPGPYDSIPRDHRRRLPWLLAGNPQHFGRLGELNTAEALAAAVIVLGEPGFGRALLDGSSEGGSFLDLNRERLAAYASAADADAVRRAERRLFGGR